MTFLRVGAERRYPPPSRGRAGWGPNGCHLPPSSAKLDPPDLAADGLRQLADELDLPGILVGRGHTLHVLLEGCRQLRGAFVRRSEDHESLDDRPPHGVALRDHRG